MTTANADKSGSFKIGGDLTCIASASARCASPARASGASRDDRDEALRTLRRVPELGINLHRHGRQLRPGRQRGLIREALIPTKASSSPPRAAFTRPGPDAWIPCGRPNTCARGFSQPATARRRAHRPLAAAPHRPKVPRDEQFDAIAADAEGRAHPPRGPERGHGRGDRGGAEALPGRHRAEPLQSRQPLQRRRARLLRAHGIGFIPWFPLAAGNLARPARRSTRSPTVTTPRRARSRSPGC